MDSSREPVAQGREQEDVAERDQEGAGLQSAEKSSLK